MKSEEIQQESNSRDKKLPTESYLLPCFLMKDDQDRCRADDCLRWWILSKKGRGGEETRELMLQISCHNNIAGQTTAHQAPRLQTSILSRLLEIIT